MERIDFSALSWQYPFVKSLLPILALLAFTVSSWAGPNSYQARTPETKVTGDLKVGAKVTISYAMTAKAVSVK